MTGYSTNAQVTTFASVKILTTNPTKSATRKFPSTSFHHFLKSPLKKSFQIFTEANALIAAIRREYIPVIRAMVPPDTPGTTLAAPIPKPFNAVPKNCFILRN